MKNINITVIKSKTPVADQHVLIEYTADIIPNLGDSVEVPTEQQTLAGQLPPTSTKIEGAGTYLVVDRTFIAVNNKVKIYVDDIESIML